ncbi:hypothetical protein OPV22_024146 [Ensete ventricosum]|uniref:Uncharacterized protein n=1 Tax=Ensete ventricosum TaxID=4639 RepID=A0AAV8QTW9_ENSVE|nr:hypothetical protein OPV22_024146 [Ensete ventricosum]
MAEWSKAPDSSSGPRERAWTCSDFKSAAPDEVRARCSDVYSPSDTVSWLADEDAGIGSDHHHMPAHEGKQTPPPPAGCRPARPRSGRAPPPLREPEDTPHPAAGPVRAPPLLSPRPARLGLAVEEAGCSLLRPPSGTESDSR